MQALGSNALAGRTIGLSVSESPDLARLGLHEAHFRLALAEIARAVLIGGGRLLYGGHLDPTGYTSFLVKELQKYASPTRPLTVCLPWQEHRRKPLSALKAAEAELGLKGRVVYLDVDGHEVGPGDGRTEDPVDTPADVKARALTAMRRKVNAMVDGRVLLGGKMAGFQGDIPGLMEEAAMACQAALPLYLAGGFGGVTLEIVRALKAEDALWLTRRDDASGEDPRVETGRQRLAALVAAPPRRRPDNGLDDQENARLAATHRPSDIAALVCLGLGRRSKSGKPSGS